MLAAKYRTVKNGESILDAGKVKAVFYGADKNTENDDSFFLKDPNAVRNFFEKTRGWILFECLHSFSRVMGVSPEKVSLGDFKARWGSCDAAKHIRLNWRLTMLPPALRDYVIVHELSHLCELNHSPAFWRIVQRFCPSYRSCRKQLREFSFLTDLYRRRKV